MKSCRHPRNTGCKVLGLSQYNDAIYWGGRVESIFIIYLRAGLLKWAGFWFAMNSTPNKFLKVASRAALPYYAKLHVNNPMDFSKAIFFDLTVSKVWNHCACWGLHSRISRLVGKGRFFGEIFILRSLSEPDDRWNLRVPRMSISLRSLFQTLLNAGEDQLFEKRVDRSS